MGWRWGRIDGAGTPCRRRNALDPEQAPKACIVLAAQHSSSSGWVLQLVAPMAQREVGWIGGKSAAGESIQRARPAVR